MEINDYLLSKDDWMLVIPVFLTWLTFGLKALRWDPRLPAGTSKHIELEMKTRVVSFMHGWISLLFGFYVYFFTKLTFGQPNSWIERLGCINSMSYFTYDLFIMWKTSTLDFAMGFHHSVCIYIFYTVLYLGVGANEVISALYCLEVSNPAMHGRAILKTYGLRYTQIHELVEHVFLISYSIARMFFYPPILIAAC